MTSVPNLIFWQAILTAPSFWFLRHVARHILICQSSPLGRLEKKKRQRWTFVNVKGTRQERTKGPFLAILSNSAVFLHSSYPNIGPESLLCSRALNLPVANRHFISGTSVAQQLWASSQLWVYFQVFPGVEGSWALISFFCTSTFSIA